MFRQSMKALVGIGMASAVGAIATAACQDTSDVRGSIRIDGSSTVFPITEAVVEEFKKVAPGMEPFVGVSGTGGGFKRFTAGETDVSNASRPIKPEELEQAKKNDIEFFEIPIAYDGLTVVVSRANYWVDHLTVDELRAIFLEKHAATTWQDVRSDWPDRPISIYAPGTDSGTFDYFKEVVAGKTGSIRGDMSVSEDDNLLVRGVSGDHNAVGFFGVAYYEENRRKLKAVPIVNPETGEPVRPTSKAIEEGDYAPFSRPLFIYVNKKSAQRPVIREFVRFYLQQGPELVEEVGYVRLPEWITEKAHEQFKDGKTGTMFVKDGEQVHMPITKAMKN